MSDTEIMSREEVFHFIEIIGASTLAGKPIPPIRTKGNYADPEDFADAMAAFGRKVAMKFDDLPERISDDPKMQELVRAVLDQTLADCALVIEKAIREITPRR